MLGAPGSIATIPLEDSLIVGLGPGVYHRDVFPHVWQVAAAFAARAHRHQVRKDGVTPYASHPFRVAMTVRDVFGCDDQEALAAALLHDTIEDTGTDYDDVAKEFGAGVADLVSALTKNMAMPEAEREAEYDARLAAADWRARLIKLADTYDNLSDRMNEEGASRASVEKTLKTCERAIALARADAGKHAEIGRAIGAVERLVGSARRDGSNR